MMRHRFHLPLLLVALPPLALAVPVAGQGCPGTACRATNATSVTVGTVMRLKLNGTTTVLASPTAAAYDAGYQDHAGPTAIVKSNQAWKLQISAAEETWTPSGAGARASKPAADLTWSTASGGGFTSLTTAAGDIATGNPTRGTSLALFYRTRFDRVRDTPGIYSLAVRLTLVGD